MSADDTKREASTRDSHTSCDGSRRREEAGSLQHALHPPPNVGGYEVSPRGWVFYDGACRFCVRSATRWGGLFARRGFYWLPLQIPGTTARLGMTEEALREEMKLLHTDGCVVGGVEAWAVLCRTVWWLWPIGVLLSLPGVRWLSEVGYRWVARNRYCLSGSCELPHRQPHANNPNPLRHQAFFDRP